jgi:hypothetical protein
MTGVAVIINFHNGFSSSNYNLSACPRVGEIVHIAEFTYEVKAVNWLTIDGSMGQVATIFTSPVLVESLAGEFVDTSTEWIPQAGDVMSRVSGISQRVVGFCITKIAASTLLLEFILTPTSITNTQESLPLWRVARSMVRDM